MDNVFSQLKRKVDSTFGLNQPQQPRRPAPVQTPQIGRSQARPLAVTRPSQPSFSQPQARPLAVRPARPPQVSFNPAPAPKPLSLTPTVQPAPKPLAVAPVQQRPLNQNVQPTQPRINPVVQQARPQRVNPVSIARPQALNAGNQTILPSAQSRTNVAGPSFKPNRAAQLAQVPMLSGTRVGIGILQAGSGAYDLASPGLGTNRLSNRLKTSAENIDYNAKRQGVTGQYKAGNVVGELATLAGGSGLIKGGAKALAQAPKLGAPLRVAQKLNTGVVNKVEQATSGLMNGNKAQQVAGQAIRYGTKPSTFAAENAFSGYQLSKEASQGQDISKGRVAQELAINTLGLPLAGAIGKQVVLPGAKAGVKAIQNAPQTTKDIITNKPYRKVTDQELSGAISVRDAMQGKKSNYDVTEQDMIAMKSVEKKMNAKPTDPGKIDSLIDARRSYDEQQAYKQANKAPSLLRNEGGYVRLPGGEQVNKPLYHGSPVADQIRTEGFKQAPVRNGNLYGEGTYLTTSRSTAKSYADKGKNVLRTEIPKDARILRVNELETQNINVEKLKADGYDGLEIIAGAKENNIVMFDPSKISVKKQAPKIKKISNLKDDEMNSLTPSVIDFWKNEGFSGVSNGKQTLKFDAPTPNKRELAELDRKITAFGDDRGNGYQNLVKRRDEVAGSYKMDHRPQSKTSAIDIANDKDGIFSRDSQRTGDAWTESRDNLSKLKNANPDTPVTIYRSAPSDKLNKGDWITLSPSYAKLMADGKADGSKVQTFTVTAKDIKFGGDDITEFGYYLTPKQSIAQKFGLTPLNDKGFARNPFGRKDSKDITKGLSKDQSEFINDYANMLEDMDKDGTVTNVMKGDEYSRQSSNSPFYRETYAETGRPPTKEQYFAHARKEIENGRAAYGASDDYKSIPTAKQAKRQPVQQGQATVQKTSDSLADNSTDEDILTRVRQYAMGSEITQASAARELGLEKQWLKASTPAASVATKPAKVLPGEAKPAKPGKRTVIASSANGTPIRERGAITSMKEGGPRGTKEFTEALNKRDNDYTIRNTDKLGQNAAKLVASDEDAALRVAKNGTDDKAVATSYELIAKYLREDKLEAAIDLAEDIAPKLTEAGRTSQAASLWGKVSTPAGALRYTQRQLDKFNEENGLIKNGEQAGKKLPKKLSPEKAREITDLASEIQKLPEGQKKLEKITELTGKMNSVAPTPVLTKLTNIWRAGLLTSLRTLEGGVIGNTTKAALDLPAQTIAAGLDKFVTAPLLNKGQRSNALTVKGRLSGGVEGTKKGANYLKTGIDVRDIGRGYDTKKMNLDDGSKIINTLGKGAEYVYRAMGTIDNPFYYSALKASRREQAVIEATNKGLKGAEKQAYITAGKLSTKGDELAANDALKAVFQNDTSLGTIAAKLKNAPQGIKDPAARAIAQAGMDVIVPFVKIPSAVATALVDYSPAGLFLEAAKQGIRKEANLRDLNNAIGKAATGTAGGIFVGASLYNSGNLTLEAPQDTNERQLWALEGKQPFSVKVAGKWRKLNYVQPVGSLMAVGGGFARAKASGDNPYSASIGAGLKAVSDQSFLKGVSGAIAAVQDPAQKAQTFTNSTVGSVIPNFIRDLARATDPLEREVNTVKESLKNGIPGLRQQNLPQRDPFGKTIDRKQSPVGVMADPFKSTKDTAGTDPVNTEIRRLYEVDREDPVYKAAPSKLTKNQTFGGEKVVLTPEQLDNFEATVGPAAKAQIDQMIKTPEYQSATDENKARTIDKIISSVRKGMKTDFATVNELKDKKGNTLTIEPEQKTTKPLKVSGTKAVSKPKAGKTSKGTRLKTARTSSGQGRRSTGSGRSRGGSGRDTTKGDIASVSKSEVSYSGSAKRALLGRGKFRSSTNGGKSVARKVYQRSYRPTKTLPKRVKGIA